MELKQLEYILKIAEEENITKASQKLFITRSALNYSLLNLEKQLGLPLFKRIGNKLVPTQAGELFLDHAQQILTSYHELNHSMVSLSKSNKRRIDLGITVGGGQSIFQDVFPEFHRKYPDTTIRLLEGNNRELENALLEGKIDLAWASNLRDNPLLDYIRIRPETPLCLAVSKDHPCVTRFDLANHNGEVIDLRLFKDELFVLMNGKSFIRKKSNELLNHADIKPNILVECSLMSMNCYFISQGLAVGFIPGNFAHLKDSTYFFPVEPIQMLSSSIMFRSGTNFTPLEQALIDMVISRAGQKPN